MFPLLWLKGLLTRRTGRLFGTSLGIALNVALLALIGAFISSSTVAMTRRAIATVPVDWQIQLSPGTGIPTAQKAIGQSIAYTALEQVNYASIDGFTAQTNDTVQTTGAGKVIGISMQYRHHFPDELRLQIGRAHV